MTRYAAITAVLAVALLLSTTDAQLGNACGGGLAGCSDGLLCVAGICVAANQGCSVSLTCADGLVCVADTCVLDFGGNGDPILKDFTGREFEFIGKPQKIYNLYSDPHHQVSMRLIEGVMFDHNGTYIGGVGYQFGDHQVTVEVLPDGNLTVLIDEEFIFVGEDPVSGTRTFDDTADRPFKVEFESFRPDMGRAVQIESGTLRVTVWAVPPGLLDAGGVPQPAYLNFKSALLAGPVGDDAQGILGETLVKVARKYPVYDRQDVDHKFSGRGEEEDYEVKHYFDTGFKFNLFGKKMTSARARMQLESAFSDVTFPLMATVGHK